MVHQLILGAFASGTAFFAFWLIQTSCFLRPSNHELLLHQSVKEGHQHNSFSTQLPLERPGSKYSTWLSARLRLPQAHGPKMLAGLLLLAWWPSELGQWSQTLPRSAGASGLHFELTQRGAFTSHYTTTHSLPFLNLRVLASQHAELSSSRHCSS